MASSKAFMLHQILKQFTFLLLRKNVVTKKKKFFLKRERKEMYLIVTK